MMSLRYGALGITALLAMGGVTTVVHATSGSHASLTCIDNHASQIGLNDKQEAIVDEGIAKGWSEEKTTAMLHMGAEKAKAETRLCENGGGGGGSDNGGGGGDNGGGGGDNGGGGGDNGGGSTSGGGTGSTGGTTGDNSPGSPSGSPGSMVTHCTTGDQSGLVNVGNLCGVGVLNGTLSNVANGILASGSGTGGLLNSVTGNHSTGGLLGGLNGLLDLGGLLGL